MIPFHKAHIEEADIQLIAETFRSGWLTMGPKTKEFENEFAKYINCEHAVAVGSATAGLHLSLKALNLRAGDEVIIPAMTFVATAEVITYFGAKPILCDIKPSTHTIDTNLIEKLITPRTKGIIPVHFAGIACDMDKIMEIAKKYNLFVIEDAAHALPTLHNHNKIGSRGDIVVFSFYATKTMTTAEGGMVCTTSKEIADSITLNRLHGLSSHAWKRYDNSGKWRYDVLDNGYKYNMTDVNATLGLTQLKKINKLWEMRKQIAKRYIDAFDEVNLDYLKEPSNCESSWHLFVIKVNNRDELMHLFDKLKIGYSVHFIPIYCHTYYKKTFRYSSHKYPVCENIFQKSLSLPIWPGLSKTDQDQVINTVIQFNAKKKSNKALLCNEV